jgi:ribosomal protein S18 acetylase RimI-like enzyme
MLKLVPMSENQFAAYVQFSQPLYAAQKMKAEGLTQDEANKVAEDSYRTLLPKGIHTPDHFLFGIQNEADREVGMLWLAQKKSGLGDYAYIYDIFLNPGVRGRGYGKAAMALVETEAKRRGLRAIMLHVFEHNEVARNLYEKVGYRTTNRWMTKNL